jgi:hypothetical protein
VLDRVILFFRFKKKVAGDTDSNTTPEYAASLIFGMFGIDKKQKLSEKQFIDG